MQRRQKLAIVALMIAVIGGLIYARLLHRRVTQLEQTRATEEQERREVIAPPISAPTDVNVKAQIFWISASQPDQLASVNVQLPLSADPVQRGKQLIGALISNPPTSSQRTLPAGATLLGFYILSDGTVVADFSDALASELPSGILSEWLAVESIAKTLETNVVGVTRLKILIHGQEAETLAGHLDLTGYFDLHPSATIAPVAAPVTAPAKTGAGR
ncbi:MAG TPA: GerMN domain-containing protein [Candidatus Acidoferrales bacterium]|nr:GerMN domain-containing protein [Candidatus Acidoferrales bacterium]